MGRTLPSTTQIVFKLMAELEPFYLALRRSDQLQVKLQAETEELNNQVERLMPPPE